MDPCLDRVNLRTKSVSKVRFVPQSSFNMSLLLMMRRNADEKRCTLPMCVCARGMANCKGCGKTYPDRAGAEQLDDGVVVPCGKSLDNSMNTKSSLLYNEVCMRADPPAHQRQCTKGEEAYAKEVSS